MCFDVAKHQPSRYEAAPSLPINLCGASLSAGARMRVLWIAVKQKSNMSPMLYG